MLLNAGVGKSLSGHQLATLLAPIQTVGNTDTQPVQNESGNMSNSLSELLTLKKVCSSYTLFRLNPRLG